MPKFSNLKLCSQLEVVGPGGSPDGYGDDDDHHHWLHTFFLE